MDPVFWLGLSIGLVAVSIAAVLIVAIPAMQELGRAAQSAEKLFDTLNRELPPTLEAIRLTSLELTELTDDVTESVQSAGQITGQVSESITSVRTQVSQAKVTTKSVAAGFKAAWQTWREGEAPGQNTSQDASQDAHQNPGQNPGQNPALPDSSISFEVSPNNVPAEVRANRLSQYEDMDSPSRRLQRRDSLKP